MLKVFVYCVLPIAKIFVFVFIMFSIIVGQPPFREAGKGSGCAERPLVVCHALQAFVPDFVPRLILSGLSTDPNCRPRSMISLKQEGTTASELLRALTQKPSQRLSVRSNCLSRKSRQTLQTDTAFLYEHG
jgi:hypothetical protein